MWRVLPNREQSVTAPPNAKYALLHLRVVMLTALRLFPTLSAVTLQLHSAMVVVLFNTQSCAYTHTLKSTYIHIHVLIHTHKQKYTNKHTHTMRLTLVYAHIPAFFLILFVGLSLLATSYVNIVNLPCRVGGILKGLDGQRVGFWGCSEPKNSI